MSRIAEQNFSALETVKKEIKYMQVMTAEKKQQVIALLKQGLETIRERAYTEIAEIPTEGKIFRSSTVLCMMIWKVFLPSSEKPPLAMRD